MSGSKVYQRTNDKRWRMNNAMQWKMKKSSSGGGFWCFDFGKSVFLVCVVFYFLVVRIDIPFLQLTQPKVQTVTSLYNLEYLWHWLGHIRSAYSSHSPLSSQDNFASTATNDALQLATRMGITFLLLSLNFISTIAGNHRVLLATVGSEAEWWNRMHS